MFNIALYQPDIPQNTAAIIRLCACFGVSLEIIEPCGFQLNDKRIKRVSMDYLYKCKIIIYKSYESFLIKKKNSRVILKKNYLTFKFKPKDTLLFGRESEGVPKIVHDKSFQRLNIPLKKKYVMECLETGWISTAGKFVRSRTSKTLTNLSNCLVIC